MPKKFKSLSEVIKNEKAFSKFRKVVKEYNVVKSLKKFFLNLTKTVIAINVEREFSI